MKNFPKVVLVLLQHLLRFIQGIIAVVEDVDKARVQDPFIIVVVRLDTSREVFVAVEAGRLLKNGTQYAEMVGEQAPTALGFV